AAFRLGRDRRVVDEGMELTALEPVLDLGDRRKRVVRIGEIDLDMIFRPRFPRAFLRERMPRAGDHPPAGAGKPLDRRMTDAAAGAGQQQGAARMVGWRGRHARSGSEETKRVAY